MLIHMLRDPVKAVLRSRAKILAFEMRYARYPYEIQIANREKRVFALIKRTLEHGEA